MIWLLAAAAWAQDCTALFGTDPADPGAVVTAEGRVEGAAVVVEGERIAAVGLPADIGLDGGRWNDRACEVVDLSGAVLTPGLVSVFSAIGLVEVSAEEETVHDSAEGDPIRAALDVSVVYDPDSTLIPVTRIGGVTSSVIVPDGGLVAGQAAWVDLAGATRAEAVQRAPVAMVVMLEGPSRAEALLRLRELIDDARVYGRNRAAFEQNRSRPFVASRLDLEALQPVLAGELPLGVLADRATDLEALLDLAEAEEVRLVVFGGAEAWKLADRLAAADVAVVVEPLVYGPGSFDQVHARPDNAALLAAAGVKVMLSPFTSHNARNVPQIAGNAVRGGLSWDQAMAAVTTVPAEVFGLPDHGTIREGGLANLVVWRSLVEGREADPFEVTTAPRRVWIHGRDIPLVSRQTLLFERYRDLPGTPLPPLPLPTDD